MRATRSLWATLIVAALGCTGGTGASGVGGKASGGAGVSGATGDAGTSGTGGAGGSVASAPAGHGGVGGRASAGTAGVMGSAGGTVGAGGGGGTPGAAGSAGTAMPRPGMTWQWQLSGTLDTTVDAQIYDLDLFGTSASTIAALHQADRIVLCYFSAGSYEPGRPDSTALAATGLGQTLDGWPEEKWLDIRTTGVRTIMQARLDLAKSRGCDGVEPDNVDGYANTNGLGLTKADQLDYNTFIAAQAHARGLSVGLKNALELVATLVSKFDWALNEECLKYNECTALAPFVTANKAVLHCEYATSQTGICDKVPVGFSTIIKDLDLDAWRLACP